MTTTTTTTTTNKIKFAVSNKNLGRYLRARNSFREFHQKEMNAVEAQRIRINTMVSILHEEHPDWFMKTIAYQIAGENMDIEGFSVRTIYRALDETNRKFVKKKNYPKKAPFNARPKENVKKFSCDSTLLYKNKKIPIIIHVDVLELFAYAEVDWRPKTQK